MCYGLYIEYVDYVCVYHAVKRMKSFKLSEK